MSSTIVAGLVMESGVSIAHVGDSRIYLIRGASIRQLTVDHSLLMEQVRCGMISMEEAVGTGVQNYLIRALGAEAEVEPDLADLEVEPDDVLLLTTDGLTRHVADAQIARLIQQSASLDAACEALIEAAKTNGGSDNISCVLVRLAERNQSKTQTFTQHSTRT
jgi:protein phosphatase